MKFKSTLLLLFAFFLAVGSCKETENPIDDPVNKGPDVVDFPTATLSIQIPEGSNFDLEGSSILSYGLTSPVEKDGKTHMTRRNSPKNKMPQLTPPGHLEKTGALRPRLN